MRNEHEEKIVNLAHAVKRVASPRDGVTVVKLVESPEYAYEEVLSCHDGPIPPVDMGEGARVSFDNPGPHGVLCIVEQEGETHCVDVMRLDGKTGTITDARILAERVVIALNRATQCLDVGGTGEYVRTMKHDVANAEAALRAFVIEHAGTLRGPEQKIRAVDRWLGGPRKDVLRLARDILR